METRDLHLRADLHSVTSPCGTVSEVYDWSEVIKRRSDSSNVKSSILARKMDGVVLLIRQKNVDVPSS